MTKTMTVQLIWNDATVSIPLSEDDYCLIITDQNTFYADGECCARFVMNEKKNIGYCKNKTWFDLHDKPLSDVCYWIRIKDIPKMEIKQK